MNFKTILLLLVSLFSLNITATGNIKKIFSKEKKSVQKVPIVYHPSYDITFFGIEKLHPFDTAKYSKIYQYLIKNADLHKESFYKPDHMITDQELLQIHRQDYLDSLHNNTAISKVTEINLIWLPNMLNFILQRKLINPTRWATSGSILAAELALKYGWAINLSGGYHHAKADAGGGFCFFADIPLAAHKVWQQNPNAKIMVIDLDAHQGNGHEAVFAGDPRVAIFDVYNAHNYPHDEKAKKYITFNYPVKADIKDAEYLQLLNTELPKALEQCKPDFIIYNAGTDILEGDLVGYMKISADGIIKRDEFVFAQAKNLHIPIMMVLSGGYTKQSAEIIGKSIKNALSLYQNSI